MGRRKTREILRSATPARARKARAEDLGVAQNDKFGKEVKAPRAFAGLLIGLAIIGAAVAAGPLAAQTASAQTVSGAGVYQQCCAQCH